MVVVDGIGIIFIYISCISLDGLYLFGSVDIALLRLGGKKKSALPYKPIALNLLEHCL